ncbi:hypothetical protein AMAG_09106 [Allomyces macrogynus ATCC 38327]|uniref:Uncharacterized protein n=1 Tax=Allomyces macrogynus (strain ATCC 38327) TaxID=578462 RepID=A0A0L0SNH9_ALLM3|nr:hypothetical protein AMAG_09106 [Allomyces macrogynus ATCC 38327]|eukprot:KNE64048.1 hypothetical protein AMAG_09106 [Allomyces macrogynus ATCC 38327]
MSSPPGTVTGHQTAFPTEMPSSGPKSAAVIMNRAFDLVYTGDRPSSALSTLSSSSGAATSSLSTLASTAPSTTAAATQSTFSTPTPDVVMTEAAYPAASWPANNPFPGGGAASFAPAPLPNVVPPASSPLSSRPAPAPSSRLSTVYSAPTPAPVPVPAPAPTRATPPADATAAIDDDDATDAAPILTTTLNRYDTFILNEPCPWLYFPPATSDIARPAARTSASRRLGVAPPPPAPAPLPITFGTVMRATTISATDPDAPVTFHRLVPYARHAGDPFLASIEVELARLNTAPATRPEEVGALYTLEGHTILVVEPVRLLRPAHAMVPDRDRRLLFLQPEVVLNVPVVPGGAEGVPRRPVLLVTDDEVAEAVALGDFWAKVDAEEEERAEEEEKEGKAAQDVKMAAAEPSGQ